jgi:2-iminobutanoate/2-iminopropanoate deaminase
MQTVRTDQAPRPAGHYSQGIVHGGVVYVSGQLPINPVAPDAPAGDPESQVRRVLRNVEGVLEAAGSGLDRLLQVTIFVSDLSLWPEVNRIFAEMLGEHRPTRAVIPCGELKRGYLLEVTAVAAVAPGAEGD